MGTTSTTKFIKNSSGSKVEEAALTTSVGAGDANRIPALNASGVLDHTIINAKTTSAGAGDANKIPALGADGRFDVSFMPTGIGADTSSIPASENLAATDLVNVWNDGGTTKVRKADATVAGKKAMGFVKAGVTSGANATVYYEGDNSGLTDLVGGTLFLSTTAGQVTATAPSGAGNVVQEVGFATSATSMNFEAGDTLTLA